MHHFLSVHIVLFGIILYTTVNMDKRGKKNRVDKEEIRKKITGKYIKSTLGLLEPQLVPLMCYIHESHSADSADTPENSTCRLFLTL